MPQIKTCVAAGLVVLTYTPDFMSGKVVSMWLVFGFRNAFYAVEQGLDLVHAMRGLSRGRVGIVWGVRWYLLLGIVGRSVCPSSGRECETDISSGMQ